MSINLAELQLMKIDQERDIANKRGFTSEWWAKRLFNKKLSNLIEDEIMTDLEDKIEDQTKQLNQLMSAWGDSFKKLKTTSEEIKVSIKKNVGDVKDYSERLKNGIDNFNKCVDDKKLENIANNIQKITDCMLKLAELSDSGMLEKLKIIMS